MLLLRDKYSPGKDQIVAPNISKNEVAVRRTIMPATKKLIFSFGAEVI